MASDTELVALRVSEVGSKVVRVVLGAQAWLSFRGCSVCQRYLVRTHDLFSARGQKRGHLAIASRMGLLVVGLTNEEEGSRFRV